MVWVLVPLDLPPPRAVEPQLSSTCEQERIVNLPSTTKKKANLIFMLWFVFIFLFSISLLYTSPSSLNLHCLSNYRSIYFILGFLLLVVFIFLKMKGGYCCMYNWTKCNTRCLFFPTLPIGTSKLDD